MNVTGEAFVARVVGGLLGQAVGDMLGFQVERRDAETCVAFGRDWFAGVGREPMRDGFAVGQVSDDTQCTLALMRTVRGDLGDEARELVGILRTMVGAGSNTRAMLRDLRSRPGFERGDAAMAMGSRDAHRAVGAPTNGAAMRAWAQAAIERRPEERDRAVVASAAVTHSNPISGEVAIEVAEVAAQILAGASPWDAPTLATRALDGRGRSTVALTVGAGLARQDDETARGLVRDHFGAPPWDAVSPHAVGTVAWAIRALTHGGGRFEPTIMSALSGGGDVDTVAGIAGAWCGIANGGADIPDHLRSIVRDRSTDATAMTAVARRFAEANVPAGRD